VQHGQDFARATLMDLPQALPTLLQE